MDAYQITFLMAVASMMFWGGVTLGIMVMLSTNLVRPLRFQMVAPVGRWHYRKFDGIESGHIWRTIEPYIKQGWERVLVEDQRGVGIYSVVLRKFE